MKLILFFSFGFLYQITEQTSLCAPNNNIGWISISKADIPLTINHPDGKESSVFTYLCRTKFESWFYAGKFYSGSDCYFGMDRQEHSNWNFQIFAAPPGSVSWVNYNGSLPDNVISVGTSKEGKALYVCRGSPSNNTTLLIPGYFEPTDAVCFVTMGSEIGVSQGFELLVKNSYGLLLGS